MIKKLTVKHLIKLNLIAACLHAVQAVAVVLLSDPQRGNWTVTGNYLTLSPESRTGAPVLVPATHDLFTVNLAYLVAAFFVLSSAAHLIVATVYSKRYAKDLKNGLNRVRWIEYSLSASTMMVGIGLLSGIYDLSSLLMMFGLTAIMNLM